MPKKTDGHSKLPVTVQSKWTKLKGLQLKTNWDATINTNTNCLGFGGLVRDAKGEVIASFSSCYPSSLSPLVAKTMALRRAFHVCRDLSLSNVVFEGDCLPRVQMVQSNLS